MTKEQATNEAIRLKQYFPFRICGIAEKDGVWEAFCGKTNAKWKNLLRNGYTSVHIAG